MDKFTATSSAPKIETSVLIDSNKFKQQFVRKSGEYKQSPAPVHPDLTKAATTVLEFHTSNEIRSTADTLLKDIQAGNVAELHAENETLRREVPENQSKKKQDSVPLPNHDDFDI